MNESLQRVFTPPTDIIEFDNRVVVLAEIAAMKPGDFTITLKGRKLIIKGMRSRTIDNVKAYHQLEVWFGHFRIEINLPWPADPEKVTATYSEGFLQVELPRREQQSIPVVNRGDNEEGTTQTHE